MKWTVIFLCLIALLLVVVGGVVAMQSDNYKLGWFAPLTSGGGGAGNSPSYAVKLTVGQSAIGTFGGAVYGACLGYRCGEFGHRVFLPVVRKDS
jgi:hypothetical protein